MCKHFTNWLSKVVVAVTGEKSSWWSKASKFWRVEIEQQKRLEKKKKGTKSIQRQYVAGFASFFSIQQGVSLQNARFFLSNYCLVFFVFHIFSVPSIGSSLHFFWMAITRNSSRVLSITSQIEKFQEPYTQNLKAFFLSSHTREHDNVQALFLLILPRMAQ